MRNIICWSFVLFFVTSVLSVCPETINGLKLWSTSKSMPKAGDSITILPSEKILLDVDFPTQPVNSINIQGILVVKPGKDYSIHTYNIAIQGGQFWVGSDDCPFNDRLTITLYGERGVGSVHNTFGQKFIGMSGSSSIMEIHGAVTSNWTHLSSMANINDTKITLVDPVNWQIGGTIVIASTDYDYAQSETRVITSISSDKKTLGFSQPLYYMHWSGIVGDHIKNFTIQGEVGYLTRNILIQGNVSAGSNFGGHLMAMGGQMHLSEIEFVAMGQTGIKARYPVHWHLAANTMAGSWVKNLAVHNGFQRCVTIHGTHNVSIIGVTGFNNTGHCFFIEDAIEQDNWLIGNLGISPVKAKYGEGMLGTDGNPAVFWITNPRNNLVGNAAVGSDNAIWYAFPYNPMGDFLGSNFPVQLTPMGVHINNTAHSCGFCILADHGPDANGNQGGGSWWYPRDLKEYPQLNNYDSVTKFGDRVTSLFENGLVYKAADWCIWIRGDSSYWKNFHYADCSAGHQFAGLDARVQDSIIVGRSQNIGSRFSSAANGRSRPYEYFATGSILGYRFYHAVGPTALSNVHFTMFQTEHYNNMTSEAAAIGTEPGYEGTYIGRSRFYGISMYNVSVPFLINRFSNSKGDSNANMVDTDGTITGVCGAQIVAKSNWIRYDGDATCKYVDTMDAYICPPDYPSLRLMYFSDKTGANIMASDGNSYNRALGKIHQLWGDRTVGLLQGGLNGQSVLTYDKDTYNYYLNYQALLPQNADYFFEWPLGSPSKFSIGVSYSPYGDYANVAMAYPPGTTFKMFIHDPLYYYSLDLNATDSRSKISPYYFYFDNAQGLLWIQVSSRFDDWLWAPRTNPFGPFPDSEVYFDVEATCPNGNCKYTVNPSTISGKIDPSPPKWKRCGNTVIGGQMQFENISSNSHGVFLNGNLTALWRVETWNGAQWSIDTTQTGPNNAPIGVMNTSITDIRFVYRNGSLSAAPYTHIKITARLTEVHERVMQVGIRFWGEGMNNWDPSWTPSIQISSPFFMERPPMNTTWKTAYIPLENLRVKAEGVIAAFSIRSLYPDRNTLIHVSEISFVDVKASVRPQSGPETCYSSAYCSLTDEKSTTTTPPGTFTSTSASTSNSPSISTTLKTTGIRPNEGEDEFSGASVIFCSLFLLSMICLAIL